MLGTENRGHRMGPSLLPYVLFSVTLLPFPHPPGQFVIVAQRVTPKRLLNLDLPPGPTTPARVQSNYPSTSLASLQPAESQTTLKCKLIISPHLEASVHPSAFL